MSIKLKINQVYKGVLYSVEADLETVRSAKTITEIFFVARRFIDRMLDNLDEAEKKE